MKDVKRVFKITFVLAASILAVWFILYFLGVFSKKKIADPFGEDDKSYALDALHELDQSFLDGRMDENSEVDDGYIQRAFEEGKVDMVKAPSGVDGNKETMIFSHPVDTNYWPYYKYTKPYQYLQGGAWPPNMFSRLYNWQPGFPSSGWSYWLRPGMSYSKWPRSRWVSNNGSYYRINNGQDRTEDYYRGT